jgi:hypothetical protein
MNSSHNTSDCSLMKMLLINMSLCSYKGLIKELMSCKQWDSNCWSRHWRRSEGVIIMLLSHTPSRCIFNLHIEYVSYYLCDWHLNLYMYNVINNWNCIIWNLEFDFCYSTHLQCNIFYFCEFYENEKFSPKIILLLVRYFTINPLVTRCSATVPPPS